jgi:hypothetical protein
MTLRQLMNLILEDDTATFEVRVDRLYETVCDSDFDWRAPVNLGDFKFFLNTFKGWVAGETKKAVSGATSKDTRIAIIEYIKDAVQNGGTGRFAGIDPYPFGIQLALRVRRPRTVHQGATCLCGPASILYDYARSHPMQYAQFAMDLFFNGHALFGEKEVRPSDKVLTNYPLRRAKIPWALDYVTLVSLRQCTFIYDKPGVKSLRGADETTLPGQLASWLRDAGYSNVQDHTFFGKHQQKAVAKFASFANQPMHFGASTADRSAKEDRAKHARQSLQAASNALTQGNSVFLFTDGELAQSLQDKLSGSLFARSQPTALGEHHWITLRKIDIFPGSAVRIKVFSWGAVYEGAFDYESFLSRYNGYVSAEP